MDACVEHVSLLEGRAQRPVEAVLEVEVALPFDDMGEEIPEERRVLVEQGAEVQSAFGRDELVEADLVRRQRRPVPTLQAVVGVGARVPYPLEDHPPIIGS